MLAASSPGRDQPCQIVELARKHTHRILPGDTEKHMLLCRMPSREASPVCVLRNHLANTSPGRTTASSCSSASPQSRPPAGPCCLHRQRQKRCPHAFLVAGHAGAAALGAVPRADGGSQALAPATPSQGADSALVTERSVMADLKAAVPHGAGDPVPAPAELGGWGVDQLCAGDRARAAETRAALPDCKKLARAPMELSGKVAELGGSCCGERKGMAKSGGPAEVTEERFANIRVRSASLAVRLSPYALGQAACCLLFHRSKLQRVFVLPLS